MKTRSGKNLGRDHYTSVSYAMELLGAPRRVEPPRPPPPTERTEPAIVPKSTRERRRAHKRPPAPRAIHNPAGWSKGRTARYKRRLVKNIAALAAANRNPGIR